MERDRAGEGPATMRQHRRFYSGNTGQIGRPARPSFQFYISDLTNKKRDNSFRPRQKAGRTAFESNSNKVRRPCQVHSLKKSEKTKNRGWYGTVFGGYSGGGKQAWNIGLCNETAASGLEDEEHAGRGGFEKTQFRKGSFRHPPGPRLCPHGTCRYILRKPRFRSAER